MLFYLVTILLHFGVVTPAWEPDFQKGFDVGSRCMDVVISGWQHCNFDMMCMEYQDDRAVFSNCLLLNGFTRIEAAESMYLLDQMESRKKRSVLVTVNDTDVNVTDSDPESSEVSRPHRSVRLEVNVTSSSEENLDQVKSRKKRSANSTDGSSESSEVNRPHRSVQQIEVNVTSSSKEDLELVESRKKRSANATDGSSESSEVTRPHRSVELNVTSSSKEEDLERVESRKKRSVPVVANATDVDATDSSSESPEVNRPHRSVHQIEVNVTSSSNETDATSSSEEELDVSSNSTESGEIYTRLERNVVPVNETSS